MRSKVTVTENKLGMHLTGVALSGPSCFQTPPRDLASAAQPSPAASLGGLDSWRLLLSAGRRGSQGAPEGSCRGSWPRSSLKHPLEMGLTTGVSDPNACISWAPPWGPSGEQDDGQAGCQRQARRTNTLTLTFSMVASSDTSYTTHTTLACGEGTRHGITRGFRSTPAWHSGGTGHGSEAQGAPLPWRSSASAPWWCHWGGVCCAHLRQPCPVHSQVPAPQCWSVRPLKGSGQTQPPQKLGTPGLAPVLHSVSLWAEKMPRTAPLGPSRSCRGTGQGCSSQELGPDTCPPGNG